MEMVYPPAVSLSALPWICRDEGRGKRAEKGTTVIFTTDEDRGREFTLDVADLKSVVRGARAGCWHGRIAIIPGRSRLVTQLPGNDTHTHTNSWSSRTRCLRCLPTFPSSPFNGRRSHKDDLF